MVRRLSICALVLALMLTTCGPPTTSPVGEGVRFEAAECAFSVPRGKEIECGYLHVPEDRSQPDGPMIQLHVAIVKSRSSQPEPDPVVYLNGGPGVHTLEFVDSWLSTFRGVLAERDLILFDQRGVGYSQPSLDCPEIENHVYQSWKDILSLEEAMRLDAQAAKACHDRLVGEGANLAAYTSAANAADVNDLRLALGYPEWNLIGGSYGTRLALTLLRDFPAGVRCLVLDSVCLPQADHYAEHASNAERAFDLLFERCAADADCAETFPELKKVLFDLVARLDAEPVTLELTRPATGEKYQMVMNGDRLISALYDLLYSSEMIPWLPSQIYDLHEGHWDEFVAQIEGWQFMYDILSEGMLFSVRCNDEAPFSSPEAIEAASTTASPRIREALHYGPDFGVCAAWDVESAPALEGEPVSSDVPALILAGDYDPIHPPSWGRLAAQTLSRSQYLEFPGLGHGVFGIGRDGGACSRRIVDAFLADPTLTVDGSCVAELEAPFVTR